MPVSKPFKAYEIDIASLEEKIYQYQFEGDDAFFEALSQDFIEKGSFQAEVTLNRSATMIQLGFHIKGKYTLVCDRSLEIYEETFETHQKQILKFGNKAGVLTEEIEVIPYEAISINVATWLFDFIALTVPMKKLHPKYRTDDDDTETLVYSSASKEETPEETDPRWDALKKLQSDIPRLKKR